MPDTHLTVVVTRVKNREWTWAVLDSAHLMARGTAFDAWQAWNFAWGIVRATLEMETDVS